MENFLCPTYPVLWIITGPGECGKSYFLTNLILYIVNEFEKNHIYSPIVHQVCIKNCSIVLVVIFLLT